MASLVVPCQCGSKLAAPESAVGRQIRCPRCGALATVPAMLPAEEVEVVDAKVVAPPPKPKPVRAEADDDDDDDDRPRKKKSRRDEEEDEADEDDRPRRKKRPRYADDDDDYAHDRKRKKPKRKSGGGALVAGLIVGGLLLVCVGIGVAVYAFGGKGSILAKKAPVPPGWEQHTYPQDGFKAFLPPGSNHSLFPVEGLGGGRGDGRQFGPGGWRWDDTPPAERIAVVGTADWDAPVRIELFVVRFRSRVPSAARDQVLVRASENPMGDTELRRLRWLGSDAVERVHRNGVMRVVCTDRHIVVAAISGPHGSRAKTEEEAAFFDNFELTN